MKTLIILNDSPQNGERTYNGARLAGALAGIEGSELRMFLMGDAAVAAVRGAAPSGETSLEPLLSSIAQRSGSAIGVCGACMDSRGITPSDLLRCAHRGSMDQLSEWSAWADKVIVF